MVKYLPLLLLLITTACSDDDDLRGYYFPVRELTGGLVYEYANTGNLTNRPHEYWYFLGLDLDTALYLSATRYADGLTPDQVARERLTNEGMVLEELTLFPPDTSGGRTTVRTEILYPHIFPFSRTDAPAAGYRLRYAEPRNPGATNYVTLNRHFRGDTVLTVLGAERRCIVFDLAAEVSQRDAAAGDISPTFTGYEIYAAGLGLVEYRRELGAGGALGGKLLRRLPMAEYVR